MRGGMKYILCIGYFKHIRMRCRCVTDDLSCII